MKVYAESLASTIFISLNFYKTSQNEILKPCEMPKEKVMHFLHNVELIRDHSENSNLKS